ncbi:MAG: hypothetical protein R3E95_03460 [Thiolinea sp.]
MDIQNIEASDLEAVRQLITAVSEHDVLPQLSLQGQEAYKTRVLADIEKDLRYQQLHDYQGNIQKRADWLWRCAMEAISLTCLYPRPSKVQALAKNY